MHVYSDIHTPEKALLGVAACVTARPSQMESCVESANYNTAPFCAAMQV